MSETVPNPSGLCMCGCGERTPIAGYHRKADGIEKGQHVRYIKGHYARTQRNAIEPPNPSGLCMCGCGAKTPLSTRNRLNGRPGRSTVKGFPVRFLPGHDKRGKQPPPDDPGPNPSGLCMCGCGQPTSIAKYTSTTTGRVRGRPMRYLKGHDKRGKTLPLRGKRLAMVEASRQRQERVIEDYKQGDTLEAIASRHGYEGASSVGWVIARARQRGVIIERRYAPQRPPLDSSDIRRLVRMWRHGATASEMRAAFGWTKDQLGSAVAAVRLNHDLAMRSARPSALSIDEQRSLKRASQKIKTPGDLTDRQRTLLRLIQASDCPMASGLLAEVMCLLGHTYAPGAIRSVLAQLSRKGLVARAPSGESYRHAPRWVWFVPADRERGAAELTLDDAKRESELAALIREQETELDRGQWADTDFKTFSLDAQLGDGDGGSWHDILVASDEPFKAGMVER